LPSFTIKEGPRAGQRFEFAGDADIGRDPKAGVSIDDRTISRRHAAVTVRPVGIFVTDLKSQNGTSVNRRRIAAPTRIVEGDEVRVGSVVLLFHERAPEQTEHETTSVRLVDRAAAVIATLAAADPAKTLIREGEKLSAAALRKRLEVMHDVSVAFHLTLDEQALLSRILEKILEVVSAADRGFIVLLEEDGETLRPGAVRTRPGTPGEVAVSKTLVWDVIRNKRGIVSADARRDARLAEAHSITSLDLKAVICVPMIADGKVHGVIALDSLTSAGAFGKDELSLLVAIAAQAALALAKARLHQRLVQTELLERDLELAARIQSRFLPRDGPERAGWEFVAHYRAAIEVGGDYYDFLELPEGRIGVGLGDVSGKGISAALCMVKLSSELRYQSSGRLEPGEMLRDANRVLAVDFEDGMFVTCVLSVVDTDTGDVAVASAGHMPPLVRRADGSVVELGVSRTPPLAVNEMAVYTSRTHRLEKGDVAVLYTDGVSEATREGGELFGMDRLVQTISSAGPTAGDVLDAIITAVRDFVAGEPQSDDITLVCFGPTRSPGRSAATTWDYPSVR
jgi:phosphoserine phosphatase RsbU/P